MADIHDLIARERTETAEPAPAAIGPEQPPRPHDLDQLIAEARTFVENSWQDVDVVLGGEIVAVSLGMLHGAEWSELTDAHPPTRDADRPYRYNRAAVARAYPARRIRLSGAATDPQTWSEVWDLLRGDDPENVQAVMWWHHVGEAQELAKKLQLSADRGRAPADDLSPSNDLSPLDPKEDH